MSLHYISDSNGKTTGVFIPIKDWKELNAKFKGLEEAELEIPSWHLEEIDKRVEDFKKNPSQVLDFDQAMNDIENQL